MIWIILSVLASILSVGLIGCLIYILHKQKSIAESDKEQIRKQYNLEIQQEFQIKREEAEQDFHQRTLQLNDSLQKQRLAINEEVQKYQDQLQKELSDKRKQAEDEACQYQLHLRENNRQQELLLQQHQEQLQAENKAKKEQLQAEFQEYYNQLQADFQKNKKRNSQELEEATKQLNSTIQQKKQETTQLLSDMSLSVQNAKQVMEKNKKAIEQQAKVDIAEIKHNIELKRQQEETAFKTWYEQQSIALQTQLSSIQKSIEYYKTVADDAAEAAQGIIGNSRAEIEDFQCKQNAINEEIRRREMEENEREAHQIILTYDNHDDILFLLDLEDKIHNKDLLHKLIWSEYLQKPYNQMISKLFGTNIPKNVIYCIENIETHKKYIGKTTALVSDRWKEHIRTSLNIGTVAKQKIHDALFRNWDKFTFSIIEVTTKEKINEREKYYIDFYKTDVYGYNMKRGG